jgi:TonB-dependent starch-binding outer membrane protein SusC
MKKSASIAGLKNALKKPFLVMKLTVLWILLFALQASAGINAQTVTIKVNNTAISSVLTAIEKQGSFRFLFNSNLPDLQQKISASFTEAEIKDVLKQVFDGTTLTYRQLDNNLIAIRSEKTGDQDIRITGRIVSETGEPVSGASVVVKGAGRGTSTDADGNFTLTVPENATLVITAIGFNPQEVAVNNQQQLSVRLLQSNVKMDEVIVVGYGTQRRRAVTGAVSTVKGDQLSKQPLLTPVQGIQGLAPGIQVVGSSEPGTQPRVTIRGLNTILTNENPLYVVDGVLTDNITNINNADVVSVDVLKDGAAAIYGSRAANGVILISTRKGKSGKPNINFDSYIGFRTITNKVKMADRNLYLDYNNEARAYDAGGPLSTLDNKANTNWFDEIGQKGGLQNYNLSIGGGSEAVTYMFSAGYLKDKGIIRGADFDRITLRSNNEYKLNKYVKLGNNLNVNIAKSDNKPRSVFSDAYRASPATPVRDAAGNYGYQPGLTAAGNPLANIELTNDFSKAVRFQGNLYTEISPVKGLTIRSAWGFDRSNDENLRYKPVSAYGTFVTTNSELRTNDVKRFYWVWDNIVSYKKSIGDDHGIELTVGYTAEKERGTEFDIRAADVPNQKNLWYISQGNTSSIVVNRDQGYLFQRRSLFARANYSFRDKYNLSGVLRRDGSSAFPSNQKNGTFYSVAGSWIISEEKFMARFKSIDFLKLRGGFARLGNDAITRNIQNNLSAINPVSIKNPYGSQGALWDAITLEEIKERAATWETTNSFDAGLEFGLFGQRLTGEVSYYNKITNAYILVPTPPFADPNGILSQSGDVRNRGVEIALNWNQKITKEISWRLGVNGTFNKNNVEKVRGGIDLKEGGLGNGEVTTTTVEGREIGTFWVYQVEGIFQNQSEIDKSASVTGTRPGDFRFTDVNKDNIIDERDRVFVGSYQPKFYYGINGGFTIRQFDFSIDCYGNAGNKVYNGKKAVRFGNENIEASRGDRWRETAPSNTEYRASNSIPKPSTYFVESGSFFRINNVTLGYNLPVSFAARVLNRARVFVSAQNPVIIKKFSGFSPELPGSNALNSGIELGVYPTSATYMIGFNVNFK